MNVIIMRINLSWWVKMGWKSDADFNCSLLVQFNTSVTRLQLSVTIFFFFSFIFNIFLIKFLNITSHYYYYYYQIQSPHSGLSKSIFSNMKLFSWMLVLNVIAGRSKTVFWVKTPSEFDTVMHFHVNLIYQLVLFYQFYCHVKLQYRKWKTNENEKNFHFIQSFFTFIFTDQFNSIEFITELNCSLYFCILNWTVTLWKQWKPNSTQL